MKNNIFVPKTINVGYQNRSGTYTGKLAYVIYTDEKGVLRKQASWDSWRDNSIPPNTYDNIPTSGFVLNKKVGDTCSHWNFRQAYCRVYDPRGFEFEITIENLLYILENTNSIVGKGLEGDFVYGWDGKDLVLLPTCSADYKEIEQYSKTVLEAKSITAKMLVVGNTYLGKDGYQYIYLGKHNTYSWFYYHTWGEELSQELEGKQFWFAKIKNSTNVPDKYDISFRKTIPKGFFIDIVSEEPHPLLSTYVDLMEHNNQYNPIDIESTKIKLLTKESFAEYIRQRATLRNAISFIAKSADNRLNRYELSIYNGIKLYDAGLPYYNRKYLIDISCEGSWTDMFTDELIDKIFNLIHPVYIELYQTNGNLYETEYEWYSFINKLPESVLNGGN
jgi:hypothetical protein